MWIPLLSVFSWQKELRTNTVKATSGTSQYLFYPFYSLSPPSTSSTSFHQPFAPARMTKTMWEPYAEPLWERFSHEKKTEKILLLYCTVHIPCPLRPYSFSAVISMYYSFYCSYSTERAIPVIFLFFDSSKFAPFTPWGLVFLFFLRIKRFLELMSCCLLVHPSVIRARVKTVWDSHLVFRVLL